MDSVEEKVSVSKQYEERQDNQRNAEQRNGDSIARLFPANSLAEQCVAIVGRSGSRGAHGLDVIQ
jgi:hypothetical protein